MNWKTIENLWHLLTSDVWQALLPALNYIHDNATADAIALGEAVLTGAASGTPWATLIATLLAQAEKKGIALAEGAAGAILNVAQTNLIAKGTLPAPVAA